jgi:hypothetical protein
MTENELNRPEPTSEAQPLQPSKKPGNGVDGEAVKPRKRSTKRKVVVEKPDVDSQSLERPPLQKGSDNLFESAVADRSQPAPKPPMTHFSLARSSSPPSMAFMTKPRETAAGFSLWMLALPYGTAQQGEQFSYPVAGLETAKSIMRECPKLANIRRSEVRLTCDANGKFCLLEIPADPAPTVAGENKRRSLLGAIAASESRFVVLERTAGLWTATEAVSAFPVEWPDQSLFELCKLVYRDDLISDLDHPILQRFRKKPPL